MKDSTFGVLKDYSFSKPEKPRAVILSPECLSTAVENYNTHQEKRKKDKEARARELLDKFITRQCNKMSRLAHQGKTGHSIFIPKRSPLYVIALEIVALFQAAGYNTVNRGCGRYDDRDGYEISLTWPAKKISSETNNPETGWPGIGIGDQGNRSTSDELS